MIPALLPSFKTRKNAMVGVYTAVYTAGVHPTHRVYSSQVVTTTTAQESHVHNIVMLITKNIFKKKGGGGVEVKRELCNIAV